MQHMQNQWNTFTQTGKVEDYLHYCRAKQQPAGFSATAAVTELVNEHAGEYRRYCTEKPKTGRK